MALTQDTVRALLIGKHGVESDDFKNITIIYGLDEAGDCATKQNDFINIIYNDTLKKYTMTIDVSSRPDINDGFGIKIRSISTEIFSSPNLIEDKVLELSGSDDDIRVSVYASDGSKYCNFSYELRSSSNNATMEMISDGKFKIEYTENGDILSDVDFIAATKTLTIDGKIATLYIESISRKEIVFELNGYEVRQLSSNKYPVMCISIGDLSFSSQEYENIIIDTRIISNVQWSISELGVTTYNIMPFVTSSINVFLYVFDRHGNEIVDYSSIEGTMADDNTIYTVVALLNEKDANITTLAAIPLQEIAAKTNFLLTVPNELKTLLDTMFVFDGNTISNSHYSFDRRKRFIHDLQSMPGDHTPIRLTMLPLANVKSYVTGLESGLVVDALGNNVPFDWSKIIQREIEYRDNEEAILYTSKDALVSGDQHFTGFLSGDLTFDDNTLAISQSHQAVVLSMRRTSPTTIAEISASFAFGNNAMADAFATISIFNSDDNIIKTVGITRAMDDTVFYNGDVYKNIFTNTFKDGCVVDLRSYSDVKYIIVQIDGFDDGFKVMSLTVTERKQ